MRLEQLYQIIEIEKHQSISKAAKSLYMGQSTLSGSLTSLEEEIGVRIFERSATGVTPTLEGYEIIQLAHQATDSCEQIQKYGQEHRDLYGTVTVQVAHPYGFLVSDILVEFKKRYPKATINLKMDSADNITRDITQGAANIGLIMTQVEHNNLEQYGLQYETFHGHYAMLFVSKENKYAERESISLDELGQEKFITFSEAYWSHVNGHVKTIYEPLIIPDRETLKYIVSLDNAIAILPDTFAERDLYCGQGFIKAIRIEEAELFGQDVEHLVYPAKRQLTLLERRTVELLRELLTTL